jgi:hypothetical protein
MHGVTQVVVVAGARQDESFIPRDSLVHLASLLDLRRKLEKQARQKMRHHQKLNMGMQGHAGICSPDRPGVQLPASMVKLPVRLQSREPMLHATKMP